MIIIVIIGVVFYGACVDAIEVPLHFSVGVPSVHDQYSQDYKSDWAKLATGKYVGRKKLSEYLFSDGFGEDLQREYHKKKIVHLKDIALRIQWKKPYDKYDNTLFLIRGCDEVIVENVSIIQLNDDYRASHSIFIEDCNHVVIKNSSFVGTTSNYHVRVEGCANVFVDNIEVSGLDYGEKGIRCGGGIFVNNGDPKAGGKRGMVSPNPKDMKWCVIQNCYVHDNLASDKWRNQDGILIHSASDGILFNCYFENWKCGDAALDVSHRRSDSAYRNHLFRVERNLFDNADRVKTPGNSHASCSLFFANNVYVNTFIGDYHSGWDVHHVHETYVFDNGGFSFFRLWGISNGSTYFINCLVYAEASGLQNVYFQGKNGRPNEYMFLHPNYLVYIMPQPSRWLGGQGQEVKKWKDWQDTARDRNSHFQGPTNCFVDPKKADYRLVSQSPAAHFGRSDFILQTHPGMKVLRSFSGKARSEKPSVGAFEVAK